MTIALARIHKGLVEPRFINSLDALQKPEGTLPLVIERLHVDRARNEIVDMVLRPNEPRPPQYPNGIGDRYKDVSHILFIDDDMLVPPNGLMRLLAHRAPIVGGLYFARIEPHLPVVYRHVDGNQWVPITEFCAGLQEVDAIGFGFCLVEVEVFKKMARPWFEFSDRMGEDMYFCQEAQKLGYKVLLDADVKCRHMATVEVGEEHFQAHKAQGLHFQEHPTKDLRALSQEIRPYRPGRAAQLRVVK